MKITPLTRQILDVYRLDRRAGRRMLDVTVEAVGIYVMTSGPWYRRGARPWPVEHKDTQ